MIPIISINVPIFNRSVMLKECINSFIQQTFKNWEFVIADDGSEEDLSFVKKMDPRIKYFRQEHIGMAKAYNLALDNSKGKYIMPFGSDDIAMPDLLEELIELIEKYKKEYDVIYSNYWTRHCNGTVHRRLLSRTLNQKDAYKTMLNKQYIPHPGSLWKKEKMPHYDESLESAVDLELFLTAMENGVRFKHRKKKLWVYRIGHEREGGTERQANCCDRILRKRGYYFNRKLRQGIKIK
jgi:glycosyltransferase involved in cell wall biosynthesis